MPPRSSKKLRKPITLPDDDEALVRLPTILGVFPIGETTWLQGVRDGRFPKGIKISPRITAWRAGKIREVLASFSD